jgi:hypothetical protein|tara:strand:- start:179 stop:307 length:129 start_codon:yes stop_codon:yes gene_type:complete
MKSKKKSFFKPKGAVWHIYHMILAIELALVVLIEFIELMYLI